MKYVMTLEGECAKTKSLENRSLLACEKSTIKDPIGKTMWVRGRHFKEAKTTQNERKAEKKAFYLGLRSSAKNVCKELAHQTAYI